MQRLTGSDAVFLYRETSTSLMHTLKVLLFSQKNPDSGYEDVYEQLKQHLNASSIVRQRIVPVPFGLHHPVLVEDPDFDVSAHVFHAAVPAPGTLKPFPLNKASVGR